MSLDIEALKEMAERTHLSPADVGRIRRELPAIIAALERGQRIEGAVREMLDNPSDDDEAMLRAALESRP